MFLDFYNLREQPFGVTPDPRFVYLSQTHREALASLLYGINTGRGFLALIAQPGMGKTTLLFHLMERLRGTATTAFLFQTQCNSRELLRHVLTDMGLDAAGQDVVDMHRRLNDALIRFARAGRRLVLIIDEAQNLENSVLETVRLLSDFETAKSKLLQIILVGQPQLAGKLACPSLAQFQQRVAILGRLDPFTPLETERYVEHRLQVAGHKGGRIFTRDALNMIAARSRGIPRNINNLCFNSLSLGYALRKRRVGPEIVAEAVADLDMGFVLRRAGDLVTVATSRSFAVPNASLPQIVRVPARGRTFRIVAMSALVAVAAYLWLPTIHGGIGADISRLTHALTAITVAPVQSRHPIQVEESVTIVEVAPHQTLAEISRIHLGRFDSNTLRKIRELNPRLTDPNHILVGQKILLPSRAVTRKGGDLQSTR